MEILQFALFFHWKTCLFVCLLNASDEDVKTPVQIFFLDEIKSESNPILIELYVKPSGKNYDVKV